MPESVPVLLEGIPASPGIAIGEVRLVDRTGAFFIRYSITDDQIAAEQERMDTALAQSIAQLEELKAGLDPVLGREHAYIIDAHIMMLQDDMIARDTKEMIAGKRVNAEAAVSAVLRRITDAFSEVSDEYLQERGRDVSQVGTRIINNLVGRDQGGLRKLSDKHILIAYDLTPADTAQLDGAMTLGFVTAVGGRTSHTAIMARSLGIPAVVGLEGITHRVKDGDVIVVDGLRGRVWLNPTAQTLARYRERQRIFEEQNRELAKLASAPGETKDHVRVALKANIEMLEELPSLVVTGAEGVGVYRTEYLYIGRTEPPGEDEQVDHYRQVIKAVSPNTTTIRTIDLGGDKFAGSVPMAREINPALGLRSIRYCLHHQDAFRTQLRAILRASTEGPVEILLPMISGLEELRQARDIYEQVRKDLREDGMAFDKSIKVGIMIEVPSTIFIAEALAREADFFSIGTNDLIQYALAIDRVNDQVSYLYDPLHPGLLRMCDHVVRAGQAAGIKVGICGEMANEPLHVPILVGLGFRELSMSAQAIPRVKQVLRAITVPEAEALVEEVRTMQTGEDIRRRVAALARQQWPEAFAGADEGEESAEQAAPMTALSTDPDRPPSETAR